MTVRGLLGWPSESWEAEADCSVPHARLYPFLGRTVRTPRGPRRLLHVFASLAAVILDSEAARWAIFEPREVRPPRPPSVSLS